jgi:hypothetical protein
VTEALPTQVVPRRRSSLRATWVDMVRSLVVIVAIVAGLVLLVPRPQRVEQPPADVASAASAAATTLGFRVSVPRGLPETWVPTSAGVLDGSEGVRAWAITYRTPSGYAGLRQAAEPNPGWEAVMVADGEAGSSVVIAGESWLHRDRPDKGTTNLVHRSPGLTTITSSLGSVDDAARLAGAIDAGAAVPE